MDSLFLFTANRLQDLPTCCVLFFFRFHIGFQFLINELFKSQIYVLLNELNRLKNLASNDYCFDESRNIVERGNNLYNKNYLLWGSFLRFFFLPCL